MSGPPATAPAAMPFGSLRSEEFPWTARHVYLNNASMGPIPQRAQRAIDAAEAKRREPHRFSVAEQFAILDEARAAAARLINADPDEIALAPNTSYGINTAAQVLPVDSGDVVLVPDREFPANVYPWLLLRARGVTVELVPLTREGWPDEARILERLGDPRVRLLAISFVQFASGYRVNLARLGAACRAQGVYLVVDAIQGLGQVPFDVRATPVDLLACGAQKWLLSPWGAGFLYVRRDLIPELLPRFTGWLAFRGTEDFARLTDYDPTFHPDARRFELATLPYHDLAGMTASLGLLAEAGVPRIAEHLRELRVPLLERAVRGRFEIISPVDPDHDSGLWCVRTPDVERAFARLSAAAVTCSLREGGIRLSPHLYNTLDEIERVAALLETT